MRGTKSTNTIDSRSSRREFVGFIARYNAGGSRRLNGYG